MPTIPTFWMEPTDRCCVSIGRHTEARLNPCPRSSCGFGHKAVVLILPDEPWADWEAIEPREFADEGSKRVLVQKRDIEDNDPRWPTACSSCGYLFAPDDARWVRIAPLYDGSPDGIRRPEHDFMVGALFDKEYLHDWPEWTGPDGLSLHCMTPGGTWCIDSIASNCTDPHNRNHKCWIRHGDPRTGKITVDKGGAPTCTAGAGSIQCGTYHGFLRDGALVDA